MRQALLPAALLAVMTLASPPARSADHPDLTGVWGTYREPGTTGRGRRGAPPPDLPMKPAAKAKVDAYHALVDPIGDQPGGWCLGYGMPSSMLGSGGYPMQIVQHEDLILIVYEAYGETRRVYLKDRVDDEELFAERNGYSFGRWDGDKLIVETTHLKESLDQRQFPHGDQARIVEEYALATTDDGGKVLTAQMTLTDPEFYTEPVTAEKKWSFLPNARVLAYECNEPAWEEHLEDLRRQAGDSG